MQSLNWTCFDWVQIGLELVRLGLILLGCSMLDLVRFRCMFFRGIGVGCIVLAVVCLGFGSVGLDSFGLGWIGPISYSRGHSLLKSSTNFSVCIWRPFVLETG